MIKCLSIALLLGATVASSAEVARTELNDGNLILEDVPPIPAEIVAALNRYQNVRSASFRAWSEDGSGIYVSTRFGDVSQLHRVDMPGGARHQLTFYKEPIGAISRQPRGSGLIVSRDSGGSEFAQLFLLDPLSGRETLISDGESLNSAATWDRDGRRIAYHSTRRNGASNDIWLMDPDDPGSAKMILESLDGTRWGPAEFSASGSRLLVSNYIGTADSRVHLLDLDTGENTLLAGGDATSNYPLAFDDEGEGFWLVSSQGGEFDRLAWQSLQPGAKIEIVTGDIPWAGRPDRSLTVSRFVW